MVGVVFGEQRRIGIARGLRRLTREVTTIVLVWHERARQRRQLQQLSDRMLQDLGLTRADVEHEASKPPWWP